MSYVVLLLPAWVYAFIVKASVMIIIIIRCTAAEIDIQYRTAYILVVKNIARSNYIFFQLLSRAHAKPAVVDDARTRALARSSGNLRDDLQ